MLIDYPPMKFLAYNFCRSILNNTSVSALNIFFKISRNTAKEVSDDILIGWFIVMIEQVDLILSTYKFYILVPDNISF